MNMLNHPSVLCFYFPLIHCFFFHFKSLPGYHIKKKKKKEVLRTFLVVQWSRLHTSNAGGVGSIPGQGTKISHAAQYRQIYFQIK